MKPTTKAMVTGLLWAIISTGANADAIDDAIAARLGFYQTTKHYFGQLAVMAKGDVEYDAETAQMNADISDYLSKVNTLSMWPMESSTEDRPGKTRALPTVWADFDGIWALHLEWEAAATNLKNTASDGLPALRAGLDALNKTCNACHDKYRAKDY